MLCDVVAMVNPQAVQCRVYIGDMKLLNDSELERSWTVANASMNRDRGLAGANSYAKELGFSPLEFVNERLATHGHASWLDLCCGNGRALLNAAIELARQTPPPDVELIGVDLVNTWPASQSHGLPVRFESASLHRWRPQRSFDLITCAHGLHYLGDKLDVIERACGWLEPDGRFAAHLDPANLRFDDDRAMTRMLLKQLRSFGLTYDHRRRLLLCGGPRSINFGYAYQGADDEAGPNSTGQRAVNSYYKR